MLTGNITSRPISCLASSHFLPEHVLEFEHVLELEHVLESTLHFPSRVLVGRDGTGYPVPSRRVPGFSNNRSQHHSHLWYRMRSGRITASKLKAACHTDPCLPSNSLIMSICYPELSKFKSAAMQWGCEHERFARDKYQNKNSQHHSELEVMERGFHISTDFPFIGASPDGLVSCKCCGDGICEIKVKKHFVCLN